MSRGAWILFSLFWPLSLFAQEPGYFHVDEPPPKPKIRKALPILAEEFARTRGLSAYEIRNMQYNRVSCDRRLFAPSGRSVEGDADLKVTHDEPDFVELDLPSYFSFVNYGMVNPYQNGVAEVDSLTGRQLMNLRDWMDGAGLKIAKYVEVSYVDPKRAPETVMATDDVRAVPSGYPTVYLVRETIHITHPFRVYFVCQ